MGLDQTKKFCTAKTNKTKRQPTEWENIFTKHISDKWLIPKCIRNTAQHQTNKQTKSNNPIKKWARR